MTSVALLELLFEIHRPGVLAQSEFDFLELNRFAFLANNRFAAAFTFADWLLEKLVLLNNSNRSRLLHFAIKAAQQIFGRFLSVFAGYLYHQLAIVHNRG